MSLERATTASIENGKEKLNGVGRTALFFILERGGNMKHKYQMTLKPINDASCKVDFVTTMIAESLDSAIDMFRRRWSHNPAIVVDIGQVSEDSPVGIEGTIDVDANRGLIEIWKKRREKHVQSR